MIGRLGTPRRALNLGTWLAWTLPLGVAATIYRAPTHYIQTAVAALLALGLVALAARHPEHALMVLVMFLPLQLVGLPLLYHYGVPWEILSQLCGLK